MRELQLAIVNLGMNERHSNRVLAVATIIPGSMFIEIKMLEKTALPQTLFSLVSTPRRKVNPPITFNYRYLMK